MISRRRRAPDLPDRLDALERAVAVGEGRLPEALLDEARDVLARAGQRLRLSPEHTVVALAGATGSGKSSLFNAITGVDLARVGVRRPTTSEPLACVWGDGDSGPLLDWLAVPQRHRLAQDSGPDGPRDGSLDGLLLLDLPDHDSTQLAHRLEVDRLVRLVDLFVWVVDPQKYADGELHERYLRPLAGHGEVTVVALNQVDRLDAAAVRECLADLRKLLDEDGLQLASVVAVSARTGDGLAALRAQLEEAVGERRAAQQRLVAAVERVAGRMLQACGEDPVSGGGPGSRSRLVDALADAAGVPAVTTAVRRSYERRARQATGWPVTRWLGRLAPDPLRRLRLDRSGVDPSLARTSLPAATPAQQARVSSAVRALADDFSAGAPQPWVDAVRRRADAAGTGLTDELDMAVAGVDLGVGRRPLWWRLGNVVQWVALLAVVAGLGWLGVLAGLAYLRLPPPPTPEWRGFPVPTLLVLGGVLAGLLTALVCRIAAGLGARRRAALAQRRLRSSIAAVADRVLVEPLEAEVDALQECRTSALVAAGR